MAIIIIPAYEPGQRLLDVLAGLGGGGIALCW